VLASSNRSLQQSFMQSDTSYVNLSEGKHWLNWEFCFWIAQSCKAWVCGRSLAGIVGSNPAGGMDICLL
jgi:hypothetical protein